MRAVDINVGPEDLPARVPDSFERFFDARLDELPADDPPLDRAR